MSNPRVAPDPENSVLTTLWDRQNVWSKAANATNAEIGRARTWALRLSIAGALLSTAAAQAAGWSSITARVLGVLAAAVLGIVPIVSRPATSTKTRDWTRLRSVSEGLKTEMYTFLAGVSPYRDEEERHRTLLERTRKISDQPDLVRYTAGIVADRRSLPEVHDVASFIDIRVNEQVDRYYRPKAAEYRRRIGRLHWAEVALAIFAAALAATTAVFPDVGLGAWVGVVTTVAGALTAHGAAQRYEYQQVEFARTADQIEDLRSTYALSAHDAAADDAFVADCERVISIQNDAWMSNLVREDQTDS